jgi:hypothetical protein
MKPGDRQKMCANCNGKVSFEATECPYCAAEQTPTPKSISPLIKNQNLQNSIASLYNPPYHNKMGEKENPAPKKQVVFTEPESPIAASAAAAPATETHQDFWALFALIVGGNLLTLGLMQFFFSEKGILTLEWDSSYWYLYCLIALPLFYYGFKKASQ